MPPLFNDNQKKFGHPKRHGVKGMKWQSITKEKGKLSGKKKETSNKKWKKKDKRWGHMKKRGKKTQRGWGQKKQQPFWIKTEEEINRANTSQCGDTNSLKELHPFFHFFTMPLPYTAPGGPALRLSGAKLNWKLKSGKKKEPKQLLWVCNPFIKQPTQGQGNL